MVRGFAVLLAVYLVVVYALPWPAAVKPAGRHVTGLFLATIAGSILEPIPAAALVLIAITLTALTGALTMDQALGGYADRTVWLVMSAFFLSRALINTGLARRIALTFVRWFGKTSLGVCYSLGLSDFVLAGMIPANGARAGGVIRPIGKAIAEIYGSTPGAHREPARVVFIHGRVSIRMRFHGDVLHRPSQQSAGGALRGGLWIQRHVGELVRRGHRAGSTVACGDPLGGDEAQSAGAETHARSGRVRTRRNRNHGSH